MQKIDSPNNYILIKSNSLQYVLEFGIKSLNSSNFNTEEINNMNGSFYECK